jgi:phospholipid transport system substrate-binding protein
MDEIAGMNRRGAPFVDHHDVAQPPSAPSMHRRGTMIRSLRRTLFAVALATGAAAVTFMPATEAVAGPTKGDATKYIETKHDTILKLLSQNPKTPAEIKARDEKVDAELAVLVDYDQMAKDALGKEWDKRTDAEKKEFTELLKQLIQKNYKKNLNKTLTYAVEYKGEQSLTKLPSGGEPAPGDVLVLTEAKNKDDKRDTAVLIDYVLRKKGSSYIAIDLVTEGSPMIRAYNKEFKKVIDKDGFPAVITKMKDKLAKP